MSRLDQFWTDLASYNRLPLHFCNDLVDSFVDGVEHALLALPGRKECEAASETTGVSVSVQNDLAAHVADLCERWSEIHDDF